MVNSEAYMPRTILQIFAGLLKAHTGDFEHHGQQNLFQSSTSCWIPQSESCVRTPKACEPQGSKLAGVVTFQEEEQLFVICNVCSYSGCNVTVNVHF